ncbi:MAG: tetratricopeptide repeat protein [Gammaproteobacteria bacterium]|nr:tetratricopeptide repeat protein [Gammaproteobacteria bacterium]
MKTKRTNWQTFIQEIKRRKVVQVVVAYIAVSWLIVQVADVLADTFDTPNWVLKALFLVLVVGLPVTAILSWVFDITQRGIVKTKELPHPSLLDIQAIPIIFHASLDNTLAPQQRKDRFRDYVLWAEDFNAQEDKVYDKDFMILFENSIDALRYAIRIQNHSQQLKLPLKISVIEARAETEQQDETNEIARARALAIDSQPGAIVTTKTVKQAIQNREIKVVEQALQPLVNSQSKIEQKEFIIDPDKIHEVNQALKDYSDTVLYPTTPITLKLASLVFLTVIAAGLWRFIPTIETKENATIAVLPFKNVSVSGEHQTFVSGLSEDIFNNISQIPDINVISRRSSQALDNSNLSLQEIGNLLNANWILEGSINRNNDQIKVSMWISDSDTGHELWSQIFNLSYNDLLIGNRQILDSLSQFLDKPLDPVSLVNISTKPKKELYPLYLQAKGILKKPSNMERLKEAEQLLKNILSQQNNFTPAIAALCQTYFSMYYLKFDSDLFEQAENECSKTNEKESKNIETLLALASLHTSKGDFRLAEQYISSAQAINPSDVEVLYTRAWIENKNGNPDTAIDYLNQALLVEPNYWKLKNQLGVIYLSQGKWQKAIDAYEEVVALIPNETNGYVNLGNAYFFKSEFDKAALAYQEALKFEEDDIALSNIATMWFYHGDYSKAANYYLKAIKQTPRQYLYWLNLADTKDQTIEYKEEAQSHYQHTLDLASEKLTKVPNDADARAVIAWCHAKTNNDTEAKSNLLIAISLSPQDPNILFLAAKTEAQLGDLVQGKIYLNQAIEAGFPESVVAASPYAKNLQLYPL